jgi:ABC-2 type transport system permease protein
MMRSIFREWRFLRRDRAAWLWLGLAFIVSLTAVTLGLIEIDNQRKELADLQTLDAAERAVVLAEQSDWGSAGYYTFHLTADAPSDFAFAAIGKRDVSPWKHRVRMLALEGQIYETDASNPDFALIGRFDFAFIASLLAPLFVIFLLFDLRSGERAAGRLELLEASQGQRSLWPIRAGLRIGLLTLAVVLPLWAGGLWSGASALIMLLATLAVALYLVFWGVVSLYLAKAKWTSSVNLTVLLGVWLGLCAVLPAMLNTAIDRAVPLPDGGEIMLTQREAVNDAWDLPKAATMTPFIERHPDLAAYADVGESFTWNWYYAFQQVGDQTAEPLSQAYREGREKRDHLTGLASFISPATALERGLERLAKTDTRAALRYEDSVRDFHAELRDYYYPRLFEEREFSVDAAADLPQFDVDEKTETRS